jgi:hypothetical protein
MPSLFISDPDDCCHVPFTTYLLPMESCKESWNYEWAINCSVIEEKLDGQEDHIK